MYEKETNNHSAEDLKRLRELPLEEKILLTQTKILEWYKYWDNKCFVSFSGGKDSTVLSYIAAQVCNMIKCPLVLFFSDTGVEYPEIRKFVKEYKEYLQSCFPNLTIKLEIKKPIHPSNRAGKKGEKVFFKDIIQNIGYPVISKNIARNIEVAAKNPNGKVAGYFDKDSEYFKDKNSFFYCEKYKYLIDAPFKVSDKCCNYLKKTPSKHFVKETGLKPIIGSLTEESVSRRNQWVNNGCNIYASKEPKSLPLSIWTENDVLQYICKYKIPICSVYGEIKYDKKKNKYYTTELERTGCIYCCFGVHREKEPNRFQQLKVTHPKLWDYAMRPIEEKGLGLREVLEYIGVKYE